CSVDMTVGASGNDLFLRLYEFSGASLGVTAGAVLEPAVGAAVAEAATNTTVLDASVTTTARDRLALQFVGLASNQAVGDFTGETGGDWVEAVAEFSSASGATATLQLQTSAIAGAGTIDGGTMTITSVAWGVLGIAILPNEIGLRSPQLDYDYSR